MSTYLYLTCLEHDPPLLSQDEVSQHAHTEIGRVREWVKNRKSIVELRHAEVVGYDDYFLNNAITFLQSHLDCRIGGKDEYGDLWDVMDPIPDKPARPTHAELADWMRDELLLNEEDLDTGFEYGYLTGDVDQHRFNIDGTIDFHALAAKLLTRIP